MLTREVAWGLLQSRVADPAIRKHSLAAEAVLAALAGRLGEDRPAWALAGLLHDLDIEATAGDPAAHGPEGARILAEMDVPPDVAAAIRRHNGRHAPEARRTPLDHALAAGETMTGLVVATALIYPDRKIAGVKVKSITKRMKERAFAASVNRETIRECEKIGLPLDEFVGIALSAMQGIAGRLGL
jgi:putative nucleotidyltransferase with HDIG domain